MYMSHILRGTLIYFCPNTLTIRNFRIVGFSFCLKPQCLRDIEGDLISSAWCSDFSTRMYCLRTACTGW